MESYKCVLGSIIGLSKMSFRDFKSKIYYFSDSIACFLLFNNLKVVENVIHKSDDFFSLFSVSLNG